MRTLVWPTHSLYRTLSWWPLVNRCRALTEENWTPLRLWISRSSSNVFAFAIAGGSRISHVPRVSTMPAQGVIFWSPASYKLRSRSPGEQMKGGQGELGNPVVMKKEVQIHVWREGVLDLPATWLSPGRRVRTWGGMWLDIRDNLGLVSACSPKDHYIWLLRSQTSPDILYSIALLGRTSNARRAL